MAFDLTVKADLLLNQTNTETNLILEIDGIPFIYGAVTVTKLALYGDTIFYGDAGLVYGGITADADSRSYIALEGTTRNLNQQLEIDKGGVGSIQKFNVELVDVEQSVTKAFQPDVYVSDILGREANVYVAFVGGAHPEDSIRIFNGIITSQEGRPASWRIGIDHPDYKKRQDTFLQVTTAIDGALTDVATSLDVISVNNLITPQDAVRTYVQIDNEIIEYSGISGNTLTALTRGSLGSIAVAHDDAAEAVTFYRLTGNPIELALKLMLSTKDNLPTKTGEATSHFVQVDASTQIVNGIYYPNRNLKDSFGLELGDIINVSGASSPANNFTGGVIESFVASTTGTVIIVSGPTLIIETDSAAVSSFNSQYNTLPNGTSAAMSSSQVDVAQHLRMMTLFPSLPDYDFYIKDSLSTLKDFLESQIYYPAGFYQIPRKGRSSVNATLPPLVLDDLAELNETSVLSAGKNKIRRQLTKDFYNTVTYKFERDSLTDRFLGGDIQSSERSNNRIPDAGVKNLVLESDGLRDSPATRSYIQSQARRFQDRYQFAAESIKVETSYRVGFSVEVADLVLFGSNDLKLPDYQEGTIAFSPRLMEVKNKQLDIRGKCSFELLDVGFGLDGRFGTVSPNSFIDANATTSIIPLKASFDTGEFDSERSKWSNFIGEEIRIRNVDFTFEETRVLIQFDPNSLSAIVLDSPLSLSPSEDYLVDLPDYPETADSNDNLKMKTIHCFYNPQVEVVSGVSTTEFTVSVGDISKFTDEAFIIVHNDDYTVSSTEGTVDDDKQVLSIDTGTNTITVNESLGFVPAAGYKVDLIGFKDSGLPYRHF